ncbi:hypothetical protein VN12_08410 [Pirellula sp. SH-Sr6A]|uniref:recombinase family protein n=1 Tax=Pirellula sp. SH-Sr6A TaxID=1632865 RepID=UPI00078BB6AF|nr:recombinase family protein [Pirellula sp. SH-Sr6A]AMV32131.1 hypothetical protein VN12_08410 [Pirellula sp. SH-Sr6A]
MQPKSKDKAKTPRAYSYIRFSTPEQALGDSERRQIALAIKYANKKGLELDQSLTPDRGLSGFKGDHRKRGSMARFLKMIDDGEIAYGSMLIVENIDRFSREPFMDAFASVTKIISAGITIETISPEASFDRQSMNSPQLFMLISQMQLAHEESRKKSERGKASRASKRASARDGVIFTRLVPAWIQVDSDGNRKLIPAAKRAIKRMFELKASGMGVQSIVKELNSGRYWQPPALLRSPAGSQRTIAKPNPKAIGVWRESYVKKILSNRAVIGEFQPHVMKDGSRVPDGDPIVGYFPPVVSESLFNRVANRLATNKGSGGPTGRFSNILRYLVRCGYCGATMTFIDKGKPPKGSTYFKCENNIRTGKCRPALIRFDEVLSLVLDNCPKLVPELVLADPSNGAKELIEATARLEEIVANEAAMENQINNLIDQIATTSSSRVRERYEERLLAIETTLEISKSKRKDAEAEIQRLSVTERDFTNWKNELANLASELKKGRPESRVRANQHLRDLIDRIDIFAEGFPELYDASRHRVSRQLVEVPVRRSSSKLRHYLRADAPMYDSIIEHLDQLSQDHFPDLGKSSEFKEFKSYVAQKRLSREARFIRISFKPGQSIDLVPPKSLADGFRFVADGKEMKWSFCETSVDDLFGMFQNNRKSNDSSAALRVSRLELRKNPSNGKSRKVGGKASA